MFNYFFPKVLLTPAASSSSIVNSFFLTVFSWFLKLNSAAFFWSFANLFSYFDTFFNVGFMLKLVHWIKSQSFKKETNSFKISRCCTVTRKIHISHKKFCYPTFFCNSQLYIMVFIHMIVSDVNRTLSQQHGCFLQFLI